MTKLLPYVLAFALASGMFASLRAYYIERGRVAALVTQRDADYAAFEIEWARLRQAVVVAESTAAIAVAARQRADSARVVIDTIYRDAIVAADSAVGRLRGADSLVIVRALAAADSTIAACDAQLSACDSTATALRQLLALSDSLAAASANELAAERALRADVGRDGADYGHRLLSGVILVALVTWLFVR